ncbi:unnamed protein product [Menidia menidia]|uniref:(Atlantic silverside) hypothetical protein n=1 Tax=Menidia menidia TaxID=238744 RepID=A0A8S4AE32_9TELE|nr:unnamed protein product [Menidia menidia]
METQGSRITQACHDQTPTLSCQPPFSSYLSHQPPGQYGQISLRKNTNPTPPEEEGEVVEEEEEEEEGGGGGGEERDPVTMLRLPSRPMDEASN